MRIEHQDAIIVERRHFAVWIDLQEVTTVLLAFERVDRRQFLGQSQFFQQQGRFHRIGRG